MSEEKTTNECVAVETTVTKKKNWFGWARNLAAAVAGAVISCAATLGIVSKSDAEMAKEKIDGWLDKAEVVYVQVEETKNTLDGAIELVKDGKYGDAIAQITSIKENASEAISTIKELKEEISEAAEAVKAQAEEAHEKAKEKATEVKETVKGAVEEVKDAAKIPDNQ